MPPPAIESVTTRALSMALDAASLRHQVIATNIANANTPGYAARGVTFEAMLTGGVPEIGTTTSNHELRARATPALSPEGEAQQVNLDIEVAAMAQNSLHQQVLLRALQRHLGLMALAASEGRR